MNACSFWFDQFLWFNWNACCKAHDLAYSMGMNKEAADKALELCVNHILWPMGWIMFIGVTLFGWLFYRKVKDGSKSK